MPKKKNQLTPAEQSKMFLKSVQELKDAGVLNPTGGEERFERTVSVILQPKQPPSSE